MFYFIYYFMCTFTRIHHYAVQVESEQVPLPKCGKNTKLQLSLGYEENTI
jgi:hypothetical protein